MSASTIDRRLLGRIQDWAAGRAQAVVVTSISNGEIVYANAAWESMCGYSLEEVIGHTNGLLEGPGTDKQALGALMDRLRSQGRPAAATVFNYGKGGRGFWNSFTVYPVVREEVSSSAPATLHMALLKEVSGPSTVPWGVLPTTIAAHIPDLSKVGVTVRA